MAYHETRCESLARKACPAAAGIVGSTPALPTRRTAPTLPHNAPPRRFLPLLMQRSGTAAFHKLNPFGFLMPKVNRPMM